MAVKGKPRGGKGGGGAVDSLVLVHILVSVRGLLGTKTALQEVSGGSTRSFTCSHSCPPVTLITA